MKIKIDRNLIIEGSIIQTIKDKYFEIKERYSNNFKYLSEEEFDRLLIILHNWYYFNYTFPEDFPKNDLDKSLISKIQKHGKLPKVLYRALSFKTKKFRDNLLKDFKKNGVTGKSGNTTSWTSDIKIAQKFLPDNVYGKNSKYGILLKIYNKDFKNNILFSIENLLDNELERKVFLEKVFKIETTKYLKLIRNKNSRKLKANSMIGQMHGSLLSVAEKEYIIKGNIKLDNADIELQDI